MSLKTWPIEVTFVARRANELTIPYVRLVYMVVELSLFSEKSLAIFVSTIDSI